MAKTIGAWISVKDRPPGRRGSFIVYDGMYEEVSDHGPHVVRFMSGTRIVQLIFADLSGNCMKPYRGKYQGQKAVTGSMIHFDEEEK